MDLLPITLGIARPETRSKKGARKEKSGGGPSEMTPELKQAVFERDDFACRYCGFKARKYMDVMCINADERDLRMDNLATACIFCHQCFNLDKVTEMRSGVLIWLPEIAQYQLNHICRAIYVARVSQGPMADASRRTLDVLMNRRRQEVRNRLKTDDPFIISTVLRDYLTTRHYAERRQRLEGVRLFPLDRRVIKEADLEFNQFPQILAYWRSKDGPFGGKVPTRWIEIYKDALRTQRDLARDAKAAN